MANEENLIPLSKRNQRERKEIQQKGSKAGVKARKEKKLLRDYLIAMLEAPGENGGTKYDDITIAVMTKAALGDIKAYEVIRDTIGQKPKEQMEVETTTVIKVELDDE